MNVPDFPHLPAESWRAWLLDEISGAARERVESHVASCAECRRVVLLHEPGRAAFLLRLPAPEAAWDGFWDDLRPRLGPPAGVRLRRRARLAVTLGAAASLAAVALLAFRTPQRANLPEPCTTQALSSLSMTRAECEALHAGPIEGEDTVVVVVRDLDLRGL